MATKDPTMPNSNMRMSFVNQTGKGYHLFFSFQNTRQSRRGGKMRANEVLANAPTKLMRFPRLGMAMPIPAVYENLAKASVASFPGRRRNGLATSASSNCYFCCLKVGQYQSNFRM